LTLYTTEVTLQFGLAHIISFTVW